MTPPAIPVASCVSIGCLRCEYLDNPLGIDAARPRLSWKIEDRISELPEVPRGSRQTAYQVLVSSSEDLLNSDKGDLWDSGEVQSDQSIQVEYAGASLESRMACYWKMRVWVAANVPLPWSPTASWTMGLLGGDPAVGMGKQLVVECDVGGEHITRTVDEGAVLAIPEDLEEPVRMPCIYARNSRSSQRSAEPRSM